MNRTFDENLQLYAELILREGLGLAQGQELIVVAEIDQAPFVRLIAREAYRMGSKNVEVLWQDSQTTLIRFEEGSEEALRYAPAWLIDGIVEGHRNNAARLGILSNDPNLLAPIEPQKVAISSRAQSLARKEISNLIATNHVNWCLVGAASPEWAQRVFPDLPQEEAVSRLWQAIFATSRVLEEDPLAAWHLHRDTVRKRKDWLNSLRLDHLRFQGPGTDLTVGLVKNHIWIGVESTMKNGVTCSPNIPTEEIFTMPDRTRVDGRVTSSKPLSLRGQIIDGIEVTFSNGEAIHARARSGEESLLQLLATDDGSKRLGEVALVPNSAITAKVGILFYNTLYDENAASHIALGGCYGENLEGYNEMGAEERLKAGANDSLIHVDWMIGSGEMNVDGVTDDGRSIPIMRAGEWVS